MAAVAWTPIAIEDIEGIFFYLARDRQSPAVAAQVVREIGTWSGSTFTRFPRALPVQWPQRPSVR